MADVIADIHAMAPELADIDRLYDPAQMLIGDGSFIYAFATPSGFKFVLVRGSGDCLAGCIDHEYWYFETDAQCSPQQVGHYSRRYSAGNCFAVQGAPLWNLPAPRTDGVCPGTDLSQLNSECVDDQCPAGLTPIHFFGIAGPNGPEFCTCSIPCARDPKSCPTGTSCVTISDGPGQVCSLLDR